MAVTLHSDAEAELDADIAYLNGAAHAAGLRFLDAVLETCAMLETYPHAGRRISGMLRRFAMTSWPYSIVYEVRDTGIHIIAVASDKRKPNYWRKRLR